jgi:hypothetical protein
MSQLHSLTFHGDDAWQKTREKRGERHTSQANRGGIGKRNLFHIDMVEDAVTQGRSNHSVW